jgi:hypothetical protein
MLVAMLQEIALEPLESPQIVLSSDTSVRSGPSPASYMLLKKRIDNACDPQNMEPNLALNLEVSDLINSKKGNAYV